MIRLILVNQIKFQIKKIFGFTRKNLVFWPSEPPSPTKIQNLKNSFNQHLFSCKELLDFDGRLGIGPTLNYAIQGVIWGRNGKYRTLANKWHTFHARKRNWKHPAFSYWERLQCKKYFFVWKKNQNFITERSTIF